MIRRTVRLPIVAAIAFVSLLMLGAAASPLAVGSKAPALTVTEWLKGEPAKEFKPGTVYVVDFWATWCGPCIRSFPKLSAIQREHGDDLVVIAVAPFERIRPGEADDRRDRLKSFVDARGDSMNFRVAYDGNGQSGANWMAAAGRNSIPCVFVVNHEGRISYLGSPSALEGAVKVALRKAKEAKAKSSESRPTPPDSKPEAPATTPPSDATPTPPPPSPPARESTPPPPQPPAPTGGSGDSPKRSDGAG
ncbi:MAG: TlpA family protein disulfide reductase [Phycisphaerae bacterium]|nr:TlpA family protein disulfide reductase [Phycisphaerae bacterium]